MTIEVYTRQSVDGLLNPITSTLAEHSNTLAEHSNTIDALQSQRPQFKTLGLGLSQVANQASTDFNIDLGSFLLLRVEFSARCRLRLYRSGGFRATDSTRAFGITPTGEHGLILDLLPPADNLGWDLSPIAIGSNADTPRSKAIYGTLQNLAGSAQSPNLTFHYIPLEV